MVSIGRVSVVATFRPCRTISVTARARNTTSDLPETSSSSTYFIIPGTIRFLSSTIVAIRAIHQGVEELEKERERDAEACERRLRRDTCEGARGAGGGKAY